MHPPQICILKVKDRHIGCFIATECDECCQGDSIDFMYSTLLCHPGTNIPNGHFSCHSQTINQRIIEKSVGGWLFLNVLYSNHDSHTTLAVVLQTTITTRSVWLLLTAWHQFGARAFSPTMTTWVSSMDERKTANSISTSVVKSASP